MLAAYSGQISAETSCDDVTAQLRLRAEDGTSYITAINPVLTKIDMYNFNFSTVISGPNLYGYYFGKLQAYDTNNEADKVWAQTDEYLWDPPCYLDITSFTKTDQFTSIDDLSTQLTYNVKVAEHGDNACRENHMHVNMKSGGTTTLLKYFTASDRAKALEPYGFNFTVGLQSTDASIADLMWKDPRAV